MGDQPREDKWKITYSSWIGYALRGTSTASPINELEEEKERGRGHKPPLISSGESKGGKRSVGGLERFTNSEKGVVTFRESSRLEKKVLGPWELLRGGKKGGRRPLNREACEKGVLDHEAGAPLLTNREKCAASLLDTDTLQFSKRGGRCGRKPRG